MIALLLPSTFTGWALAAGALAVLVIVGAIVLTLPAAGRADREAQRDADTIAGSPLLAGVRAWLVPAARVRHDVLGLGTVVDTEPSHAPWPGVVLVRFDALSDVRWTRPAELDPVTPDDERRLQTMEERRSWLLRGDGVDRGVWPRECSGSGHPMGTCHRHSVQCGMPGFDYCCGSCPARSGGAS